MADVLLSINEDESDPLIKENIDVSVPTDLTVSVSVPSYSHQEISEASSLLPDQVSKAPPITEEVTVKRLRSELQFQKLNLAQRDADLDRFQAERRKEVELLQRHVHLSSRENEALQKENHVATERIVELQINNSKLKSENVLLEDAAAKAKHAAGEWVTKWTDLNTQFQQLVRRIDRREFTFENYEQLRISRDQLKVQCESLTRENREARRSADKWRKKFNNLRNQYESRIQEEVSKLRYSIQNQIELLRTSSTEHLETRLLEAEERRTKAVQEANQMRHTAEQLRSRIRDVESKLDKTRGQLEKSEASKNELIQRLASATSSRSRIEKDLEDTRVELHQIIDCLKQDLVVKERQSQHFEMLSDTQAKRLQEYEEVFLGIHGTDEDSSRWPTLLKVQSQHSSRMSKRVTELETEKQMLLSQHQKLVATLHSMEAEIESREKLVSHIETKAPETVRLFRDKDALLRELRSQLNHKDLLLADYARQVEKLRKTRNQLAADLKEILRDRTELEALKRILSPS